MSGLPPYMTVEDGFRRVEPFRQQGRRMIPEIRVSKRGMRLYLNGPAWEALGSPERVILLADVARCRVAIKPAPIGDEQSYMCRSINRSPGREIQFQSVARMLRLDVQRAQTVPHATEGFRTIVDLRDLRPKEAERV